MHKFVIVLLFISKVALSQTEISWETLSDVEFSEIYVKEEDAYALYPHFGSSVIELAGQEVLLSGYILAIDPTERYFVLSQNPFAACFFCGSGGPETVVELKLKSENDYFKMDEFVTMKGVLRLNSDDFYQCVYIFDYAEAHRR